MKRIHMKQLFQSAMGSHGIILASNITSPSRSISSPGQEYSIYVRTQLRESRDYPELPEITNCHGPTLSVVDPATRSAATFRSPDGYIGIKPFEH
jgi:hypothetical protein